MEPKQQGRIHIFTGIILGLLRFYQGKIDVLVFSLAHALASDVGKGGQFYLVTDNIPFRWVRDTSTGLLWPYNARTVNFRLGVNIVFGFEENYRGVGGSRRRPGSRSGKYCPAYD